MDQVLLAPEQKGEPAPQFVGLAGGRAGSACRACASRGSELCLNKSQLILYGLKASKRLGAMVIYFFDNRKIMVIRDYLKENSQ